MHLAELDLPSLKYQRQCGDMIMIYTMHMQFLNNCIHDYLNVDASDLLISNNNNYSSITRGHKYSFFAL